jgi:hypothetical protein
MIARLAEGGAGFYLLLERSPPIFNADQGLKTVGEIRQMSDDNLLALQDFGPGSVTSLRETLGPSTEGVSPTGKNP